MPTTGPPGHSCLTKPHGTPATVMSVTPRIQRKIPGYPYQVRSLLSPWLLAYMAP